MEKKEIIIEGGSLPFFEYKQDGLTYFEFDASESGCPEPMVNAMAGLQLLDNPKKRLIMINGHEPNGLYPRIEGKFTWEAETLENGLSKITFTHIEGESLKTDFSQISCSG